MGILGRARRAVRRVAASTLFHSRLLHAYRRRVMNEAGIILLYHRVTAGDEELLDYSPSGMTVSQDLFAQQLSYLKRFYRVVPLEEMIQVLLSGSALPDRMCAVSFDDGWLDNHANAFPVLRRYRVPATIFLTTNFIEGGAWFWEERLKYLLAHIVQCCTRSTLPPDERMAVQEALETSGLAVILAQPPATFRRYLSRLVTRMRRWSERERRTLLDVLESLLSLSGLQEPRRFMDWQEVREMAGAGVSFGAHTLSHANLALCDTDQAVREIRESKLIVERAVGQDCKLFAYPFGRRLPAVRQAVADAGFVAAVTIDPGLVRKDTDILQLNRIDIATRTMPDVSSFACGITPILRGL